MGAMLPSAPRPALGSERARLAAALRAHVARRRTLGERRVATVARAPAARAEARAPLPAATAPSAPPTPAQLAPACADLASLRAAVAGCRACALCETRTQTVFADGPELPGRARVMFVGEAPGFHEDAQGIPFVGPAGALLTDIIVKGMRLARADVYIANVLKCRPPDNRDPQADEKALCTAWLDRQIELVDPAVLIPLGRHAANHLLGTDQSMGRLRGRVHAVRGRKIVPTYHPAYLLRNPADKRRCWEDIQLALGVLGAPPAGAGPDRPGPTADARPKP
jgi:DNA polymerase